MTEFESATEIKERFNQFLEDPERSPYFSHWNYTGNALQRAAKSGPREPIWRKGSLERLRLDVETLAAIEGDSTVAVSIATAATAARKALSDDEVMAILLKNEGGSQGRRYKKSPWVYRCIDIKSKALAAIPWQIEDKNGNIVKQSRAADLLREVNPESNWQDFIMATYADLDIYGNAYWLKSKKKGSFIQRLNPSTMRIEADGDGIQRFKQALSSKDNPEWPRERIVYFHRYDPVNDIEGVPPIMVCADAIDVEIEADKHLKAFFTNRAMPDFVFSMETTNVKELARMASEWKRQFAGAEQQHKTGFIGGSAVPKELGFAPKDLALATVRLEARRAIAAAFGVPAAMVGAWEAANYATLREQRQSLYTETVLPDAMMIEGIINAEFMPWIDSRYRFRWLTEKIPALQENVNDVTKRRIWLVEAGIIKREKAAELEGFAPEDVPEEAPKGDPTDNDNFSPLSGPRGPVREDKKSVALGKWRRKALKRLKNGQDAHCNFISEYVPDGLHKSILDGLENAEDADAVKAVFEQAETWGDYPGPNFPIDEEDEDMKLMELAQIMAIMNAGKSESSSPLQLHLHTQDKVEIKQDIGELTPKVQVSPNINVPPSKVDVHVPEQKSEVTVKNTIDTSDIAREVGKTLGAIEKFRKQADTPVIAPKVRRSKETKKVTRSRDGSLTGSESTTEYEYD